MRWTFFSARSTLTSSSFCGAFAFPLAAVLVGVLELSAAFPVAPSSCDVASCESGVPTTVASEASPPSWSTDSAVPAFTRMRKACSNTRSVTMACARILMRVYLIRNRVSVEHHDVRTHEGETMLT